MTRPITRMQNANHLKLGLFGMNCSGGLTMTKAPERWEQSWDNNLAAAGLADEAGLEFLLPIARWHGYRGGTDTEGTSYETLSWASGLLASTRAISAFRTVHVSLVNPVFAAKQIVTADHIGKGRFGLNVVSGWNEGEFAMFGATLLEHDERYAYTEAWTTIAERIWSEDAAFDFAGQFFDLKGVLSKPKPSGGGRPMLMSAGSSVAGRAFAARQADCLFMNVFDFGRVKRDIAEVRASADGREVHYIVHEMGDWAAAEHIVAIRISGGGQSIPPERVRALTERHVSGIGTYPLVGTYDEVAGMLKDCATLGWTGWRWVWSIISTSSPSSRMRSCRGWSDWDCVSLLALCNRKLGSRDMGPPAGTGQSPAAIKGANHARFRADASD